MQFKKKFLSLLLTAAMVLVMLPVTAGAAGVTSVKIGNTELVGDPAAVTGATWDGTDTLTLDGNTQATYGAIEINCDPADEVTIVVNGDVTVTSSGIGIDCGGELTVSGGSSDVLTINTTVGHALVAKDIEIAGLTINARPLGGTSNAVDCLGSFTMSSGTLNITVSGEHGQAIYTNTGDITINGTATVQTLGPTTDTAIVANRDLIIGGSAVVDVAAASNGAGIHAFNSVNISGGTVTTKGPGSFGAISSVNGISVTGGSLTVGDSGGSNGNVKGDLAVSGTGNVTVNGNITGDLNVSGGTVNVTGTVSGTVSHTGGTLTGSNLSVCQIGSTGYGTLGAALAAITTTTPTTIKLLANINHTANVVIDGGKNITFDLNGKTLDITAASETALKVLGGAKVNITGAGALNVTSNGGTAVAAYNAGSEATVTNATGKTGPIPGSPGSYNIGVGAMAEDGGKVTVLGNATGYADAGAVADGMGSYGVWTQESGSLITVKGNITANGNNSVGALAALDGKVTIEGNVSVTGEGSMAVSSQGCVINVKGSVSATGTDSVGARAFVGGKITIDGAVSGEKYIGFYDWDIGNTTYKTHAQYEAATTKAGYYTYTYTDSVPANGTSTVWVKIPGGGGSPTTGGGGDSGGGSATAPSAPVTGDTINPTPSTSNGTTSVTVTESNLNTAIGNAVKAAETSGGAAVTISFTAPAGSYVSQVTLPKAGISSLVSKDVDELVITDGKTTLTFDEDALAAIGAKAAGDVVVSVSQVPESKLTAGQKEAVNGRPVYDFSITSGDIKITDFGGGTAGVTVPYTLADGENPNAVVVYYLDADGGLQIIENGVYDPVTETFSFSTNHFSLYVIGYNPVSFTDVLEGYWGRDYIEKAAARGLVSGVGSKLYQPGRSVTRAEFAQMAANVLKLPAAKAGTAEYSDVKSGAWYYDAVMNAKSAGLLDKFTGEFKPNQPITREEMSAILAAILKQKGIVGGAYAINLGGVYTDFDMMSEEYFDDIMVVTVSKLMQGIGGGKFDPQGLTTRAQAATVQIRLLEMLSK